MKKNPKIKKSNFCLFKQHLILKIIFILMALILTFISDKTHLIALFGITLITFGFCSKIYINWIKIVIKMIPLFISLYLFVIISSLDFWNETFLIVKIIYLALLSVYLAKTTSRQEAAEDLHIFMKYRLFNRMFFFVIMTVSFIPVLINKLSELKNGKSLETCLNNALSESKNIYYDIDKTLVDYKKRNIWTFSNLYLMCCIVGLFFLAVS